MKSLILSSAGLKNLVNNQNYEEEFIFFFDQHEIKMKSIYADFISPYVSQIHHSDPTINCVHLSSQNSSSKQHATHSLPQITDEIIQLFESLSIGNSIEINKSQCSQLRIISILLQNEELFSKLDSLFPSEKENENEKINENLELLSFIQENSQNKEIFNQNKAIQYIASNLE